MREIQPCNIMYNIKLHDIIMYNVMIYTQGYYSALDVHFQTEVHLSNISEKNEFDILSVP